MHSPSAEVAEPSDVADAANFADPTDPGVAAVAAVTAMTAVATVAADSSGPGDRLIRIGAIVFFVGAAATLVTVAPLFLGTTPFPTYMYLLSMLMGAGFLVAGAGVLRSVAAGRRARAAREAREARRAHA